MVTLTGKNDTICFGTDGYILHKLDTGTATLTEEGGTEVRTVRLEGYILPADSTAQARRAAVEQRARTLRRLVASGFLLTVNDRHAVIRCSTAPVFSSDPPFSRGEAGFFTLTGQTVTDGYFYGEEITQKAQGRTGSLAFPLDFIGGMKFGTLTRTGAMLIDNTGDSDTGFVFTLTAVGGTVTELYLANGTGGVFAMEYTLQEGKTLTLCTVTGHKSVTVDGTSALSGVVPSSTFFRLPTGESVLYWTAEGTGYPAVTVTLAPVYIE